MAHLLPLEGLLKNLKQEIPSYRRREYLTRERAYELLKQWTGQDFGFDADKWGDWVHENQDLIYKRMRQKES